MRGIHLFHSRLFSPPGQPSRWACLSPSTSEKEPWTGSRPTDVLLCGFVNICCLLGVRRSGSLVFSCLGLQPALLLPQPPESTHLEGAPLAPVYLSRPIWKVLPQPPEPAHLDGALSPPESARLDGAPSAPLSLPTWTVLPAPLSLPTWKAWVRECKCYGCIWPLTPQVVCFNFLKSQICALLLIS